MATLRFANVDDAADFVEIYRPSVVETAASFEEIVPSIEEMRSRIQTVSSRYPWLVAVEGSRVVGYAYAYVHNERASYRWSVNVSVYVREPGRGIGRQLYTRLFKILSAMRIHRAYAGITLPNEASVRLHESFGFRRCALYTQVGYKFGAWHDVGWWEMSVSDGAAPEHLEPLAIGELDVSDLDVSDLDVNATLN